MLSTDFDINYTYFTPLEVVPKNRYRFYDQFGNSLYAVGVVGSQYLRSKVRLASDPEYYSRPAYILYDAKELEDGNLTVAGYLIDRIDLVSPDRVIELA